VQVEAVNGVPAASAARLIILDRPKCCDMIIDFAFHVSLPRAACRTQHEGTLELQKRNALQALQHAASGVDIIEKSAAQ